MVVLALPIVLPSSLLGVRAGQVGCRGHCRWLMARVKGGWGSGFFQSSPGFGEGSSEVCSLPVRPGLPPSTTVLWVPLADSPFHFVSEVCKEGSGGVVGAYKLSFVDVECINLRVSEQFVE